MPLSELHQYATLRFAAGANSFDRTRKHCSTAHEDVMHGAIAAVTSPAARHVSVDCRRWDEMRSVDASTCEDFDI